MRQDGTILRANKAATHLFLYSDTEFKKNNLQTLFEEDFSTLLNQIGELNEHESTFGNGTGFKKNGEKFPCELHLMKEKDEAGNLIIITHLKDCSELQKNQKLSKENAHFQAVLNSTEDSIYTLDTNHRYTSVYGHWLETWNLNEDMFLGKTAIELFDEENGAVHIQANNRVLKGEHVQYNWFTNDGKKKQYFRTSLSPIVDAEGNITGITGVAKNVTELKEAEKDALKQAEMSRLIMDSAAEAIYGIDMDGNCTVVNKACLKMLGYRYEKELLGRNIHDTIHYKTADGCQHSLEECKIYVALRAGKSIHDKNDYFWKKDGTKIPVEYWSHPIKKDGIILGCVVTFFDISDRLKAEEKLQQSYKALSDYKYALDVSANVVVSDTNGTILDVNDLTCKLSGYTRQELIGQNTRINRSGYHSDSFYSDLWETINSGRVWRGQMKNKTKQGTFYWVDTTIVPFLDESGKPQRFLAMRYDITAQKEYQLQLGLNERKFRAMIQDASDHIGIVDMEGNYKYVSPSYEHVTGKKPAELIGLNGFNYVHSDDIPILRPLLEQLQYKKMIKPPPYRFLHHEIGWRWIKTRAINLLHDEAVQGIVINSRDITEPHIFNSVHQLEREALESFMRGEPMSQILENLISGLESIFGERYAILEIKSNALKVLAAPSFGKDYSELVSSFTMKDNMGSSATAAIRKEIISIPEIQTDSRWDVFRNFAVQEHINASWSYPILDESSDKTIAVFTVYYKKAQNPDDFEEEMYKRIAEILRVLFTSMKKDHQLKLSNERHTYINKASNDAMYDWDIENDTLDFGNSLKKITGYDVNNNLSISEYIDLVHPDDQLISNESFFTALSDNKTQTWSSEYRLKNKNESFIYVYETAYIKRDPSGKAIRMIGAIRNIHDRKIREIRNRLINDLSIIFNGAPDCYSAMQLVLNKIAEFEHFPVAEAWLKTIDGQELRKVATFADSDESARFFENHEFKKSFKITEGLPGLLAKSTKKVIWNDIQTNSEFNRKAAAQAAGLSTAFALPFEYGNEVVAVLIFFSKQQNDHTEAYSILNEEFGRQIGAEIRRKLLDDELSRIVNLAPEILCVVGMDGYFKKFNPAAMEILGYSEQELLSRPYIEFVHPEDQEITAQIHVRAGSEKLVNYLENRYITKSGEIIWFGWSSSPVPNEGIIIAVAKNITGRKKAESAIKESNERFERAAEATQDAIWDLNVSSSELIWGKGYWSLFGYDPDTFPSKRSAWEECIHPDDWQAAIETMTEVLHDSNKKIWQHEYRYLKADGTYAYVLDRGSVIRDEVGEPVRMVGAMQDITHRKEFEDSLRNMNLELQNLVRALSLSNAELEQFAFVASHDLQEPLRMISSFLSQIERKYDHILDDKGKKYIYFAIDGAKRMRQIILDLLDFSRVGKMESEKSRISMNEVLNEIIALNRKVIELNNAKITSDELPEIVASKTLMTQIVQNLILNGVKYHKKDRAPEIHISCSENKTHWEFCVKDNGIGIDAEYHDKIFNIFQRLHSKEEYSGTGIGLAICKKAVDFHDGKIWLDSTPGKGSSFYFTISKKLTIDV